MSDSTIENRDTINLGYGSPSLPISARKSPKWLAQAGTQMYLTRKQISAEASNVGNR